ncbi:ATP-binding cassette domain-containing protein [Pseudodonghicola xiamenensis]|uniref:ABC transporter ATP-binding protein n=1 Tax=Pseudodonghicola xiamenensis TaxID=337702 RepID=A0A8J3HAZ8_9RHOB|nr:ATP-binding cassette domain-containing protein [Pseudodonghicola xiamenensis]GHG98450.1 ABC transporter ATP-binding protein [Pseudodonghicola xiamenensis]
MTVLEARNLGVRLGREFAVVVEHLQLARGELRQLSAPSGAGKSTVLGLLAGAIPAGELPGRRLRLCGENLDIGDVSRRRAELTPPDRLGLVLQTSRLVPFMTLSENIDLPLRLANASPDAQWRGHLLETLGITALCARFPDQVSVGQRQRVSIARALLARPALVLLDEPVSALDPANVEAVEGIISRLAREAGSAVLLASHRVGEGVFATLPKLHHRLERDSSNVLLSVFSDQLQGEIAA